MRPIALLAALGLACTSAQAGIVYVELTPTSPTTVPSGGMVDFRVGFRQYQESWSFDNNGPEPSADIGFQEWISYFWETYHQSLTGLTLQLGAAGGPQAEITLPVSAPPGSDFATAWTISLPFADAGSFLVQATAMATQDVVSRRGDTVGTRECVGFDNSVQCSNWSFVDRIHEDSAFTAAAFGSSLAVWVQVVPEPATWALWLAGAGLLAAARRRRA